MSKVSGTPAKHGVPAALPIGPPSQKSESWQALKLKSLGLLCPLQALAFEVRPLNAMPTSDLAAGYPPYLHRLPYLTLAFCQPPENGAGRGLNGASVSQARASPDCSLATSATAAAAHTDRSCYGSLSGPCYHPMCPAPVVVRDVLC